MSENKTYPKRYHLNIKGKRTTVSIERTLSYLACTWFGRDPYDENAHSYLREKIQEEVDKSPNQFEKNISQGVTLWLTLTICNQKTMSEWLKYSDENRKNQLDI